jgi:anti-sigma B factor antagonist
LNIDLVAAGEGPLLLRVSGDLERSSRDAFCSIVDEVLARARPVVIDLTGVEFLDSSGLGALLDARRRALALGIDLRIAGEHGSVARLLQRTGTLAMLTHG